MTCTIYLITCLIHNKRYVGLTSMTLRRRWLAHVADSVKRRTEMPLHHAIRKYGADAFNIQEIASSADRATGNILERQMIIVYQTRSPRGYNATDGGDGGPTMVGRKHAPETNAKISAALTGRKIDPEVVQRIAAKLRGRKLTPEHIAKLGNTSEKNKGRIRTESQKVSNRLGKRLTYLKRTDTGTVGCTKSGRKIRVTITRNGIKFDLGSYATLEQAQQVYKDAAAAHIEELKTGRADLFHTPDKATRRSKSMKAVWENQESRTRLVAGLREAMADPSYRAKNVAALSEIRQRPEVRAQYAIAARKGAAVRVANGYKPSAETKRRASESMRAYWAARKAQYALESEKQH